MEAHLKVIGLLLVLLSLVHVVFPARFEWKKQLEPLSLLNRQMMYVHTFFIALMVLLMGLLCLSYSQQLVGTPLGRGVSLGLFIFWGIRLIFQFVVYSPALWRGRRFETAVHVLFSLLWAYFTFVFFIISFAGRS